MQFTTGKPQVVSKIEDLSFKNKVSNNRNNQTPEKIS
jgi:hypothetical protein